MSVDQAQLLHESAVEAVVESGCATRWLITPAMGARHVLSYRVEVEPGGSSAHWHPGCEEALYVVHGRGRIWIDDQAQVVAPGTALFVPDGAEHGFENAAAGPMIVVGAMAPPIEPHTVRPVIRHLTATAAGSSRTVKESAVTSTMMGERSFKVLVNPELGCRQMTQFTGVIPTGRAPLHAHPHEEAVYILAGHGRLWIEDQAAGELRPGSAIFFPIGVRHTLENTSERELLRVLGAFSPAGSPEAKLPPPPPP